MTKYTIKTTNQFKKDFKLAQKRHLNTELLKDIIAEKNLEFYKILSSF